jgi:hypothetical protein
MRLFMFAAGLLLASSQFVRAADDAITIAIVTEPATITAGYREDKQSDHVILSTTAAGGLPALYLRASPLKSSNSHASIAFPGNGGRDWIELPASSGKSRDVPFDVKDLEAPGTYEGQIEALQRDARNGAVPTKVVVIRPDPSFAPVFGGPAYKDGQLTITASDPQAPTSLTVQLPQSSRKRELEVVVNKPLDEVVTVKPARFDLGPGEQKVVFLQVKEVPFGTSTGTLTVRDAKQTDVSTELFTSATRVRSAEARTLILFSFVFLGALISVLLNNIFPVSLAKRRTRQALADCNAAIHSCTNISPPLEAALLAETARLELLNGSYAWYTTTKAEQMRRIETLRKSLHASVGIAGQISRLRTLAGNGNRIFVRLSEQVEDKLLDAENALVDNTPDVAKNLVDETEPLLNNAGADANLNALRSDLGKEIERLLTEAAANGRASIRPRDIVNSLEDLQKRKDGISSMSLKDLLGLERNYHIAKTFIRDFECKRRDGSCLASFQDEFVSRLKGNVTASETRLLVELARTGQAPEDVAAALKDGNADIYCETRVAPDRLTDFRFQFDNANLHGVDAALRLCSYNWDFKDGVLTPPSEYCRHFIVPRKNGGWLTRAFA